MTGGRGEYDSNRCTGAARTMGTDGSQMGGSRHDEQQTRGRGLQAASIMRGRHGGRRGERAANTQRMARRGGCWCEGQRDEQATGVDEGLARTDLHRGGARVRRLDVTAWEYSQTEKMALVCPIFHG